MSQSKAVKEKNVPSAASENFPPTRMNPRWRIPLSADSLDSETIHEHDVFPKGPVDVQVDLFDLSRVEPGLFPHFLSRNKEVSQAQVDTEELYKCSLHPGSHTRKVVGVRSVSICP